MMLSFLSFYGSGVNINKNWFYIYLLYEFDWKRNFIIKLKYVYCYKQGSISFTEYV